MYEFDVSVIVPIYNHVDELIMTLDSLRKQTLSKDKFEIVIADDGSSEDVEEALAGYDDLHITYCCQEDSGFRLAAVRNLGIKNSSGKIIVFNDTGIMLSSDVLQKHCNLHNTHGENTVVSGYMFGTDAGSDLDVLRNMLDNKNVEGSISSLKEVGNMGDGRERYFARFGEDMGAWYIPWLGLWGGHFSVSSAFIDKHNILFDENFTTWGGEDNDFGIQLCHAGAKYFMCRDIEVVHYPTIVREKIEIRSESFKERYNKTKEYIRNKYKTEDVIRWYEKGSSANDKQ